MATFRNPINRYTQTVNPRGAFWACILFGSVYFAYKGAWKHALLSLLAAILTFGISWFIYPFCAYGCVTESYLERGWEQISHDHPDDSASLAFYIPFLLLPLLGLAGYFLWPKPAPAPRAVVVEETRRREGPLVIDRTEVVETEGRKVVSDTVKETIELAPGMAEALKVGEGLTGLFGNLGKVLGGVTNEESARSAIRQLSEFAPVLESLQKSTVALPEAGRSSIVELVAKNMGSLKTVIDAVMAIPGVKEILGPTVTPMIDTLSKLGK
jgi:hypothetical protein